MGYGKCRESECRADRGNGGDDTLGGGKRGVCLGERGNAGSVV
jgi:hypothetical protein